MNQSLKIYFFLIALILFWSLNTVLTKMGLNYMPPVWLTASRFFVGTLIIFIFLGFRKQIVLPKRRDIPFILSIGILQMSFFQIFINYGLTYVHAGRASILIYSTPLWVTPFAILFFGEKLSLWKLLGLILGIAGIFVLFSPHSFNWLSEKNILGNGLLLLASLCWALVMLHTRYGKWHSSPLNLLPWQLLVGSILPILIATLTEPYHLIIWNKTLVGIIFFSGIIATALGYWLSITVSKALPVITTSLSLLSVPVFTLIFSAFLIHEPLTLNNMIAMALIIAGLTCMALESRLPNFKKT